MRVELLAVLLLSGPSHAWAILSHASFPPLHESVAPVGPGPEHRQAKFRLFARVFGALSVNRVSCQLISDGAVCRDTTGSNVQGGFWPKGSPDGYVFDSGLQVAGVIGGIRSENPWAGDTAAAFFIDFIGNGRSGEQVTPIYNSTDPADLAVWPQAANVPDEPNEADNLFDLSLRGRQTASESDVWWLTWDGNPDVGTARRTHPLGLLLEQRGMAWNSPDENRDILYFVYTLYNITSTRVADYVGVRPAMREILLAKAKEFQERNSARAQFPLPTTGYPIVNAHVAFAADMDVGPDAGDNFVSVNVPFALGYAWARTFPQPADWTFDPEISHPPFFTGVGLVGVKYLRSPRDSLKREEGLTVFGGAIGGALQDPTNSVQLYRYLSGTANPAFGDARCNTGDPLITHICFINRGPPEDMRFFQATGPVTILPGHFESVVVAYVFAAPLPAAGCPGLSCGAPPGDPTILGDPDGMAAGVNPIDTIAGYAGFEDRNHDGKVDQSEFKTVPGSLLGKALTAQTIFDSKFLLASTAPAAPDFFLIPGANQVSIIWKPSTTEVTGDPSFALVSEPLLPTGAPNSRYDPNFRQFDVEGYRIYRGRVDTPSSLQLIAQFDYAGTSIVDWRGQINPSPGCAPELGIDVATVTAGDTTFGCPVPFDSVVPGVVPTVSDTIPLSGTVVQVKLAPEGRQALATGSAIILHADTGVSGAASACVASARSNAGECGLRDTGVPFSFVDRGVRNDLLYFYTVTAFDVNSLQSGPSSLESPRIAKKVSPSSQATNLERTGTVQVSVLGRGVALDTAAKVPTIDEAGRFAGPFPPANALAVGLGDLIQTLVPDARTGTVSLTLDSLRLGSAYENGVGVPGTPASFYFTSGGDAGSSRIGVPVVQDQTSLRQEGFAYFDAVPIEEARSRPYGGGPGFGLMARLDLALPGNYYSAAWGRGCLNAAAGFTSVGTTGCEYNGPRWFDGPSPALNESAADPQSSHPASSATPGPMAGLGNAGALTGVTTIQMPHAYETVESGYRVIEGMLGTAQRAADFNVWWGAGGRIDSIIDITHNVTVPFDSLALGATWGVMNESDASAPGGFDQRPDVLSAMDFTCVEPLRSSTAVQAAYPCTATADYPLSRTVLPGPVAIFDQTTGNSRTVPVRAGSGFALYLAGNITMFELAGGPPEAGTVWTLRTYVGAISGGRGGAGNRGPYAFAPQPRPLTAVGVEVRLDYAVTNRLRPPTAGDLSRVHTVPDPYYVTSGFEHSTEAKTIQFVNLPADCIIRIYSSSGVLVSLLEHHDQKDGGSQRWNVLNRNTQVVASGVYFYHIEAGDARRVGRFVVINFAP